MCPPDVRAADAHRQASWSAAQWLLIVLSLDGAGVIGLSVTAAVMPRPSMIAMAMVAAAGWGLALAGILPAVRDVTRAAVRQGRMRVCAGLGVNTLGGIWVLVSFPTTAPAVAALLAAGIVLSVIYLALLARLLLGRPPRRGS
jgi:hypothetical protein